MQELQYHIEQSRHLGQQVPGPKSAALDERRKNAPVSYTHLTLPTILLV